jgi:hypothetical protein
VKAERPDAVGQQPAVQLDAAASLASTDARRRAAVQEDEAAAAERSARSDAVGLLAPPPWEVVQRDAALPGELRAWWRAQEELLVPWPQVRRMEAEPLRQALELVAAAPLPMRARSTLLALR